jgi:hypothetical protein
VAVVNRLVALVLALALFLAASVAVVDIVLAAFKRPHWIVDASAWANWLRAARWYDGTVRLGLVGAIVLGLILLFVGLRRGRPSSVPLTAADGVQIRASRRAVERAVDAAARRVEGVSAADVSVRRRRVRVRALTRRREPGDLEEAVRQAVSSRLTGLGLEHTLTPSVRLRTGVHR